MKHATAPRLDELDDPAEGSANRLEPVTAPPPFEPSVFAQALEDAADRATLPPGPAFEMLRDSCKMVIEDEIDAGLTPPSPVAVDPASSHVKIKAPRP